VYTKFTKNTLKYKIYLFPLNTVCLLKCMYICFSLDNAYPWIPGGDDWNYPWLIGKTFNYTIKNALVDPMFQHSITLPLWRCDPIVKYMEMACRKDSQQFTG